MGCPEGAKGGSFQTVQVGGYKGSVDNGDCPDYRVWGVLLTRVSTRGSRCIVEEGCDDEKVFGSLIKKGSDFSYN